MPILPTARVATLWELAHAGEQLCCAVYRRADGLHLSIESETAVLVSEPCSLQPRAIRRMRALRDSLMRRGWTPAGGRAATGTPLSADGCQQDSDRTTDIP